jgi:hypothetical protein
LTLHACGVHRQKKSSYTHFSLAFTKHSKHSGIIIKDLHLKRFEAHYFFIIGRYLPGLQS